MKKNDPVSIWDVTAAETEPNQTSAVGGKVDVVIVGGGLPAFQPHCIVPKKASHVMLSKLIILGLAGQDAMLVW